MDWLHWAVYDPAPRNCGYSFLNIPCEVDPSLKLGVTIHSVGGYFTYISPSGCMVSRGNSWDVTIMRDGTVWVHRKRPTYVNWHAGGPAQNIGTWAIEMEGYDEPWTDAQKASLLRVCIETWQWFDWHWVTVGNPTDKTQEGIRAALLGLPYGSMWEHNWFDYTSCPMGRNEWLWLQLALLAGLSGDEEEDMQAIIVKGKGSPTRYVLLLPTLQLSPGIPFGSVERELKEKEWVEPGLTVLEDNTLDWLKAGRK